MNVLKWLLFWNTLTEVWVALSLHVSNLMCCINHTDGALIILLLNWSFFQWKHKSNQQNISTMFLFSYLQPSDQRARKPVSSCSSSHNIKTTVQMLPSMCQTSTTAWQPQLDRSQGHPGSEHVVVCITSVQIFSLSCLIKSLLWTKLAIADYKVCVHVGGTVGRWPTWLLARNIEDWWSNGPLAGPPPTPTCDNHYDRLFRYILLLLLCFVCVVVQIVLVYVTCPT